LPHSPKARVARILFGLVLSGITAWIVLPVLASSHNPPPPVALQVGTNGIDLGANEEPLPETVLSVLDLQVTANGCSNPVVIEGTLSRPVGTWPGGKNGRLAYPPSRAIVTFAGAHVDSLTVGLSSLTRSGEAKDMLPLVRLGDTATAVLDTPRWSDRATSLWFTITANLERSNGFDSCYMDLPQLFPYQLSANGEDRASAQAAGSLEHVAQDTPEPPRRANTLHQSMVETGLGAGSVTATVAGRRAVDSSIGLSGSATASGGVHYLCRAFVSHRAPASGITPEYDERETPDCSGVPMFDAVDLFSDTTRQLFAAGIIGALGASLIIEAIFMGETDPEARPKRPRWRRAA
jgi:hypothetical protein